MNSETLELNHFIKGLHLMSVDGQKPSFFTPTVNHDVAPFTPTVNHDVAPKAIESNPSEIDYDVTCILFYHGLKHDESSGYSSGDKENASGYSSEEEENDSTIADSTIAANSFAMIG